MAGKILPKPSSSAYASVERLLPVGWVTAPSLASDEGVLNPLWLLKAGHSSARRISLSDVICQLGSRDCATSLQGIYDPPLS